MLVKYVIYKLEYPLVKNPKNN